MIEVQMVEVSKLHESKTNPRSVFDKAELAELTNSIREKGVLSPLFVRNWPTSQDHEIISGARRYRAAKSAGLKEVPCIIRVLSDEEALGGAQKEELLSSVPVTDRDARPDLLDRCRTYRRSRIGGCCNERGSDIARSSGLPSLVSGFACRRSQCLRIESSSAKVLVRSLASANVKFLWCERSRGAEDRRRHCNVSIRRG